MIKWFNQKTAGRYAIAVFLFLLAACGSATSQPTVTALPPRPTLPPAWTVTPTFTPLPPTLTRTPTLTPSITPTLSPDAICEQFEVVHRLENGMRLEDDGILTMVVGAPPDFTVRFLARHSPSGENLGADMIPGPDTFVMQLALDQLPRLGTYLWSVVILSEEYGDLCLQRGSFILAAAPPDEEVVTSQAGDNATPEDDAATATATRDPDVTSDTN